MSCLFSQRIMNSGAGLLGGQGGHLPTQFFRNKRPRVCEISLISYNSQFVQKIWGLVHPVFTRLHRPCSWYNIHKIHILKWCYSSLCYLKNSWGCANINLRTSFDIWWKNSFVFRISPQVQQQSYHQFNNGHFQPIFYMSDTETERSLGEVTIPMTTFISQATRKRIADDQILDASQLESTTWS